MLDEGRIDADLWAACVALDEASTDRVAAVDGALPQSLLADGPSGPRSLPRGNEEARTLWPTWWRVSVANGPCRPCSTSSPAKNVFDTVRPMLIRHLASHLDLGMAAWPGPAHGQGFYAAWRQSAGIDLGWELDELVAARDESPPCRQTRSIPSAPRTYISGQAKAHWGDYLERLSLELPGWSGMFLWRDQHPNHAGSEAPVTMVVRLPGSASGA